MRTVILSAVTLLFLNACSNEPAEKVENTPKETLVSDKVETVTQAKEIVSTLNAKTAQTATKAEEVATTKVQIQTGSDLYTQRCASCHGNDAKKSALNSSKVIAGWSVQQTEDALKGYQAGSYGGKMKGIMQAQSKSLSDIEITRIAEYISLL